MGEQAPLSGPDLKHGVAESDVRDGVPLLGHADGEAIVLVRDAGTIHAVGASCSHYGGPLAEGRVFGGAIHCPWHHACFDLATGHAHGPALAAIACWDVALENGTIRVGAKRDVKAAAVEAPENVVIIGGGAAGVACAEALRSEGHTGAITIVNGEGSDPVDRPNLSKDYLAGNAPEEWVFLRTKDMLAGNKVTLVDEKAASFDPATKSVKLASGNELAFDALLIATGAEPIKLPIPGADLPHVHTLRTLANSKAIANAANDKTKAVVIGASFIGLEAAASLRARGASVTVVGPETVPLARVLGDEVGAFVKSVHEGKGVAFALGRKPASITAESVTLDDGTRLEANLVVMGVGVKPRTELAEAAGLKVDRGVIVDSELRAATGVWAAGDIARYPYDGEPVRIEHWQVATRHGQAVARSMLGKGGAQFVPFFWSQHHDVTLGYVGHAETFDKPQVKGNLEARDAHVVYRSGGAIKAVVTIGRDQLALDVEAALENHDAAALEALVK
ncbi:MAG TPA: FAD-dependent oxidoreductase [Kofleriaceae bacterium]|jgi:NADPH-dependent 2,4-dienoyl-CoA reductase/sulfur reductase-like enzyme/nitrite reductase/ring-hydroxylating ferredoxin subunit